MNRSRVRIEGSCIEITGQLFDAGGRLVGLEVELGDGHVFTYVRSKFEASVPRHQADGDLPFLTDLPQSLSVPEAAALAVVLDAVKAALHDKPLVVLTRAGLLEGACAGRVYVTVIRALRERSGRQWSRPAWKATSVRLANAARRAADLHDELALLSRDAPVDLAALTALAETSHGALARLVEGLEIVRPDIDAAASASGGAPGKAWRSQLVQDLACQWREAIADADIETAVDAACRVVDLIDLARPETIVSTGRFVSSGQFPHSHRQYVSVSDPPLSDFEDTLPFR